MQTAYVINIFIAAAGFVMAYISMKNKATICHASCPPQSDFYIFQKTDTPVENRTISS